MVCCGICCPPGSDIISYFTAYAIRETNVVIVRCCGFRCLHNDDFYLEQKSRLTVSTDFYLPEWRKLLGNNCSTMSPDCIDLQNCQIVVPLAGGRLILDRYHLSICLTLVLNPSPPMHLTWPIHHFNIQAEACTNRGAVSAI